MSNLFSKLPYLITGDNYEQLKKYDSGSRKKINILGWFAFIPSFLWFLSGFLLCYKILETSLGNALLVGAVAATMIFIFERNIVQSVKTHWGLALIRISLGLFIAIFSSVILDLVIFENDITHYAQEKMIKTGEQKVNEANKNVTAARERLNLELEGKSNSKARGFGRIATEKKEQMRDDKTKLENAEADLTKLKSGLGNNANPEYKKLLTTMGLNTVLNRVKLLHEFVSQNSLAFWSWFILLMIGILLEVFGVLTKCFYPKSDYEKDQETISAIMANKRKIVLEQSMYYTSLGVSGRDAFDTINSQNRRVLN